MCVGATSLPLRQSRTNRFTGGNTAESFVLCKGCGFPAKEMRKAVAGFAGDQPNAMLALSAEERFFLSALPSLILLQIKRTSGILRQLKSTEDSNEKAFIGHG